MTRRVLYTHTNTEGRSHILTHATHYNISSQGTANLNSTAYQHSSEDISSCNINKGLEKMTYIVTFFKHSRKNHQLPKWYDLIQDVETHFGTIFDVFDRFLTSVPYITDVLCDKTALKFNLLKVKTNIDIKRFTGHL